MGVISLKSRLQERAKEERKRGALLRPAEIMDALARLDKIENAGTEVERLARLLAYKIQQDPGDPRFWKDYENQLAGYRCVNRLMGLLPSEEFQVLSRLVDQSWGRGYWYWQGQIKTLSNGKPGKVYPLSMSYERVRKLLASLEQKGLITRESTPGKGVVIRVRICYPAPSLVEKYLEP